MHGMYIPVADAVAQAQLDTGMRVFRGGQLSASLAHFTEAAALMPLRSPVRALQQPKAFSYRCYCET